MLAPKRLILLIAVTVAISPGSAGADSEGARPAVSVSGGLGGRLFDDSGAEGIAPIQARIDVSRSWSLELGEDIVCSQPACALLGFYRAGALFFPLRDTLSPYAYGRLAYFVHPAHSLDGRAREYNVGPHWGAGAGVEIGGDRLALYLEGGIFGDFGGAFVAPTAAVGVLFRFGARR